jgi:transposase
MAKLNGPGVAAVGVDVAKATLSVFLRAPDGTGEALSLRNTDADARRLAARLAGFSGRIVMESTGHYHWRPALALSGAGLDVRVVNPILSKKYTAGTVRKVKTDPADASALARMAHLAGDDLPPRFAMGAPALALRKRLSAAACARTQLQALRASLRSLAEARESVGVRAPSPAERSLSAAADALDGSVSEMEAEFAAAAELVADRDAVAAIDSIPGVTRLCALVALHWLSPGNGAGPKSWVAFAGLDVSSRESGTWRGKCRLTKRGNADLRRRLYSAAWGAAMPDGPFRDYYLGLKADGHPHVEALTIVARKIVRLMHMAATTKAHYDPSLAGFPEPKNA